LAVLLISHDVALVSRYTDKVAVISSGRIADTGPTRAVLEGSAQAEVREMIDLAVRRFERQPLPPAGHAAKPLVSVRKATVSFPGQGRNLLAVNEADLDVFGGECLALLGESGSGKTTLARVLAGLQRLHSGTLEQDMPAGVGPLRLRRARFSQVIRQEGVASLSPAFSVSGLLAEPGIIHHFRADPASALQQVGLGAEFLARRPHELSGGQARRVGIARALTITPRLLIADEPTSGLDAPVAEEILELLRELRDDGRATLLITHDIDAAKAIADRVAIMHAGRLVEVGPAAQVLTNPEHPETIRLLSSRIDPRVE
jgi:ABC-type glutathione transport system ATPase component